MWRESGWVRRALAWRRGIILAVLALSVAFSAPNVERIGDRLQVALPVLALGCAVLTGGAGELLVRYMIGTTMVHGSKVGLGERAINARPWGGFRGFPSGHSAAAAFGASALVQQCVRRSPLVQGAVIIAAGFTGASRIEAGAHTIWQVLAGIVIGWASERLLRRNTPLRRRICTWFATRWRRRKQLP